MELRVKIITRPDEVFWKQFDKLSDENFLHNVQFKSIWLIPYIKYLLKGSLYIIAVYEDDKMVGCLPLEKSYTRATRYWNFLKLSILGGSTLDFFNILAAENIRGQIIKLILEHLERNNQWDYLTLSLLPNDKTVIEDLNIVFRDKYKKVIAKTTGYRHELTEGYWDLYQKEIFYPKNKDLNKSERRLKNDGIDYDIIVYRKNIFEKFKDIQDLYAQRRESLNQWNKYENKNYWLFLEEVLQNYEKLEGVEFSTLINSSNEILALQLDFINKGIRYHWNHAYNENFKRYSPGKILLKELLKLSFNNPQTISCNHMRGLGSYKEKLTSYQEMFYEIRVERRFSIKVIALKIVQKILRVVK